MVKTLIKVVAVAFGAVLVGQTAYVEYLFHSGLWNAGNVPETAEVLLAWAVVLGGLTAYLVRRATRPVYVTHVTHVVERDEDDVEDEDEE